MCIIIHKPAGVDVSSSFKKFDTLNPDGAGVAWIEKNTVKMQKGFFNYKKIPHLVDFEAVFHFRLATSGLINRENCHPFFISKNTYVFHNGIFNHLNGLDEKKSDTTLFVEFQLLPLARTNKFFYRDKKINSYLHATCAQFNKLVFIDPYGVVIINKNRGQTIKNIWYSQPQFFIQKKQLTKLSWCFDCQRHTMQENNICSSCAA